nr:glycosyltransferase family 4 protein [uncultured Desulfobacter sp.]
MMKLLYISSDKFPPFRVDVSVLFGYELVNRKFFIDWVLQSEKDCNTPYHTQWRGCTVWVGATDNGQSRWRRLKKHLFGFLNYLKVNRLAKKKQYDVILVKDLFIAALIAMKPAKKSGAKFVYWLSYPFPEASIHRTKDGTARYPFFYLIRGTIFKFLLYKIIMPETDHIFVQSEQMKLDVSVHGIPPWKLTPVPMGVEINRIPFQGYTKMDLKKVKSTRVVYLGTLSKVRKMDFLIRVFSLVIKQRPDALLYLVGSGDDPSDEQSLIAEAKKFGILKSVIMTGFLPMDKAWEYVREAVVCVSPIYPSFILDMGSPTKLIEYMAMGKAVVANDNPEQRRVIQESGAGLCVPYDEKRFADAIVILLNNPEKAFDMGVKGRKYVEENRSYSAIADLVEKQLYKIKEEGK